MKKKKRVLIIRCGLLGDTVDATSVIEPLMELYNGNVEINWVSRPGICDLFKFDKRIKKTYILRRTKLPFYLNIDKLKIILESFFNPYELILNLEIGNKFNDIVSWSKSNKKIGMPNNFINDDIFKEHRVEHQLRILNIFNDNYNKNKAIPSIIGAVENKIKNKFPLSKKFVVLCPTNSHFKKENYRGYRAWPIDSWNKLIKQIISKTNLNIILVGDKKEHKYFNCFYPLHERTFDLSGKTTIPELITIMKLSEFVIATDSGSVHIAGASASNIISIHGPTNYYQSAPYKTNKNNIKIATLNLPCSPCYDTQAIKKCSKNICMHNLSPEKIFDLMKGF